MQSRIIARLGADWKTRPLVHDTTLRDSTGHLKQTEIQKLDREAKVTDAKIGRKKRIGRPKKTVKPSRAELTDAEILSLKSSHGEELDLIYSRMVKGSRPSFREFLRRHIAEGCPLHREMS
jgi:hypothetical protein